MGCDIHAHWEVKISGKWLHYDRPNIERNYRLFTRMAGVRAVSDEIEAIVPPRGLPTDMTQMSQFDRRYCGEDGHSDSWLGVSEIEKLYAFFANDRNWNKEFGFLFGNGWEGFRAYPRDYPKELEDFRLVFWFNN